jgi:hypothetical protein
MDKKTKNIVLVKCKIQIQELFAVKAIKIVHLTVQPII